jgi:DNA-binding LacI/PurR family transcriptional regulator
MGTSTTLTDKFAAKLRREIRAGRYNSEAPLPSERGLAGDYDISRVTARRSLRQLCQEGLIAARPARGYFVIPGAAEALAADQARAILFVQRGVDGSPSLDTMHTRIVNGALAEAQNLGLEVYIICQQLPDFRAVLRNRWGKNLRGVLLDWARRDLAEILIQENIPFVLVENDISDIPAPCVIQDNAGGIQQAMEHLAAAGHQRMALIGDQRNGFHTAQRTEAFGEFYLREKLKSNPAWIALESLDVEGGRRAIESLLKLNEPPTAVLVFHREMIDGVCAGLQNARRSYPDDISLLVWGDPEPGEVGGTVLDVDFVSWNKEEMGGQAIRALEDRLQAGESDRVVLRIRTNIVKRRSVGRPCGSKQVSENVKASETDNRQFRTGEHR